MGYTHYFTTNDTLDHDKFKQFSNDVKAVIKSTNIPLAYEYDTPNDKPLLNHETVRFNGVGDDGHETFLLERDNLGFEFCKTAYKPYDVVVVAALSLAKYYFGDDIDISSDGDRNDWNDGVELAVMATNRHITNPMI